MSIEDPLEYLSNEWKYIKDEYDKTKQVSHAFSSCLCVFPNINFKYKQKNI